MIRNIKNLVLSLSFVKEALKAEYRQGGIDSFPLAEKDILETMRDDLDKKADELAREKLSKLLSVIDEKLIVSFSEKLKAVFIGNERCDDSRLASLKAEAEYFLSSDLWKILNETPKRLAQKALFEDDGDSKVVHTKGRAILYTLDTQKRILETFKSFVKKE